MDLSHGNDPSSVYGTGRSMDDKESVLAGGDRIPGAAGRCTARRRLGDGSCDPAAWQRRGDVLSLAQGGWRDVRRSGEAARRHAHSREGRRGAAFRTGFVSPGGVGRLSSWGWAHSLGWGFAGPMVSLSPVVRLTTFIALCLVAAWAFPASVAVGQSERDGEAAKGWAEGLVGSLLRRGGARRDRGGVAASRRTARCVPQVRNRPAACRRLARRFATGAQSDGEAGHGLNASPKPFRGARIDPVGCQHGHRSASAKTGTLRRQIGGNKLADPFS